MLNTKTRKLLIKIAVVITTFFFGLLMCTTAIAVENKTAINNYLKVKEFSLYEPEKSRNFDMEYFKSDYANIEELIAAGKRNVEEIEAGGAVLLKNDNGALPLDVAGGEKKISLFGISSVDPATGGRGSAQTLKPMPAISPKTGFENAGFEVNGALHSFYSSSSSNKYKRKKSNGVTYIGDAPWTDVINAVSADQIAEYGAAAIFTMSRVGGEGSDLGITGSDGEGGNYLKLSDTEKSVLRGLASLKAEGKVKKIIVLLNTTNQIESEFLYNSEYDIDAALWVGTVGINGFNAIGEIVAGYVNPSGHLSDTFWFRHSDNPVMANSARYAYADSENKGLPMTRGEVDLRYNSYMVYQEGIYLGYRYTETRYYEKVMNNNADTFDYSQVVSHPFGSGLSYTNFTYSNFNATDNGDGTYTVTLDVTNAADGRKGRDVVQVYVSKPYTEYDKTRGIEKSAVDLVGFAKTKEIAPGATESVSITVDEKDFAVYDANDAKTYIVTEGDYLLTAAHDAHDAVNNILAYNDKSEADGMDGAGDKTAVEKFSLALDKTTYAVSEATDGTPIKNLFDDADVNKYFSENENKVTYMSRADFAGTFPKSAVSLKMTQKLADDMLEQNSAVIPEDSTAYPTYGAKNNMKIFYLRADKDGKPIAYDDPLWDKLLDQLTWEDTVRIVSNGLQSTVEVISIVKPGTVEENGPTGITMAYGKNPLGLASRTDDPDKDKTPPYYPCMGILASSFDVELAANYGNMLGEDAIWAGYAGFYGIGVNTHRNPYGGRAYEYYSEDGFLAGKIAASEVEALQAHGCNAYIKHFALNDQEAQRAGIAIWANEQTLREIYLKPFELSVTEGGAMNAMASFTRIGATMCPASKALLTDYLRGELGMKGLVVTDMYAFEYDASQMPMFITAGCDLPDGDVSPKSPFNSYKKNHGDLAWQMREAAHRVLYATAQSNAMNGMTEFTIMKRIIPGWRVALIVLDCLFGVLFAASAVGAVLIILADKNKLRPSGKNKN